MAFNNNTTTNTGAGHKPTMGEKISGAVDSMVGKVTNNPAKVVEGEAKKHGDPVHGAAAGAQQAMHGHSSTSGPGLTGNHGTHTTGTGLTGNHNTGSGLTGNHGNTTGTGLTGNHGHTTGTGLTGSHNTHTGTGLTGNHGHSGLGTGIAGHDNVTALGPTAGTGYGSSHTGAGLTGTHDTHGTHGTGLTGNHGTTGLTGTHGNTGLTGNHGNTGLTGTHSTGLTDSYGTHGTHDTGLTGNPGTTGMHTGAGVGTGGGRNAGYEHGQPTMGDKLSGTMESTMGKATNNPVKVAEGEAKRTGDPHQGTNPGTGAFASNHTTTLPGNRY